MISQRFFGLAFSTQGKITIHYWDTTFQTFHPPHNTEPTHKENFKNFEILYKQHHRVHTQWSYENFQRWQKPQHRAHTVTHQGNFENFMKSPHHTKENTHKVLIKVKVLTHRNTESEHMRKYFFNNDFSKKTISSSTGMLKRSLYVFVRENIISPVHEQ